MLSDRLTSKSVPARSPGALGKKRKWRTRWTVLTIFLFLVGLTSLEYHFVQQQSPASTATNIAVLVLFNIILILLFVLIILITRHLVKLYNERKSRIIGSRFQTKLIIAFLILALVPSVLLFTVASKLFTYSIGSWFNLQVEQTLQQSMEVARDYYAHREGSALSQARKIEGFITRQELFLLEKRDELHNLIKSKVEEYELGGAWVYDNKGHIVVSQTSATPASKQVSLDFQDLLERSIDGEGVSEFRATPHGDFLVTAIPLTDKVSETLVIWGYIVTLTPIPGSTHLKIESIQDTYEGYKQQKFLKLPVSASYYITFLMITLLILFSAIWLGFYMARGITIPIQEVAEGTRRIAEGDLDFRINAYANDEIGILVSSFNQMTRDLKESRIKLQRANEDLQMTNIELERRRFYIETILESIGAGVVSVDKKGRITTFNKAAENILDIKAQEVFGSSYRDAFDLSFHEPVRKMIRRMNIQGKEFLEEQLELRVKDTNLILLVNMQVLRDTGGKYLGLVVVFEDLTQLIKAQKIAAWREVAQGIAHEIKNPLTPIQLNTQRLRKKFYEDKKDFERVFEESIDIISQEVEGMKELLSEFQRFSRMPMPNPKPTSLHKIIDDIAVLYSNQDTNVTIKKHFDPNIHLIQIDSEQFRRVFINLFENALDAVNGEGEIEISTQLTGTPKMVRIDFSDNGIGILPEDREKLFLPHFTTKKRGTGLGLAIINRIVVDHNGTIEAKDNRPKGTVIVIHLPLTQTPPPKDRGVPADTLKTSSSPF